MWLTFFTFFQHLEQLRSFLLNGKKYPNIENDFQNGVSQQTILIKLFHEPYSEKIGLKLFILCQLPLFSKLF